MNSAYTLVAAWLVLIIWAPASIFFGSIFIASIRKKPFSEKQEAFFILNLKIAAIGMLLLCLHVFAWAYNFLLMGKV